MRVAMVTARFRPLLGGVETHVAEIARRLASAAEITVLTTDPSGELPAEEAADGVVVRRFAAFPRGRDYYASPGLVRAIRRDAFDLVHVQGAHTLLAPMALGRARSQRLPAVTTFHTGGTSSSFRRALRGAQWRAERPLLRSAASLVAVCEYEIERFAPVLGLPRERFSLIRNGADPLPVSHDVALPRGDPLVVSVARLERYKGHHRAIAAMPKLLATRPGARLAIVGTGPYEGALREQVRSAGLDDVVHFTAYGAEERGALGALVRSADLAVLLSDYEAHPVAVMEALGLGTRVLVAATSGLAELGRAGLATVVDRDATSAEVARAMAEAIDLGRWRSAPLIPSWDECAAQLRAEYERACAS